MSAEQLRRTITDQRQQKIALQQRLECGHANILHAPELAFREKALDVAAIEEIIRQTPQSQGVRRRAEIIAYPGGRLGDVGLFLNWAGHPPLKT